jgi:hypothetical protein
MYPALRQVQSAISWLFDLLGVAWVWSIGQINQLLQIPMADLMVWQMAVWVVVTVFLVGLLYTFFHHVSGAILALWSLIEKLVYLAIGVTFLAYVLGCWSYVAKIVLQLLK